MNVDRMAGKALNIVQMLSLWYVELQDHTYVMYTDTQANTYVCIFQRQTNKPKELRASTYIIF